MDSITGDRLHPRIDPLADKRARARMLVRWAALVGIVLVLVVTTSSAFLRVRAAGLGCEDWPACYGPTYIERMQAQPAARLVHRLSASAAGACVIAIIALALVDARGMRRELILGVALLAVTAFLAVLGRSGANLRIPAVALGNVLGGFALLLLFLRVASTPPSASGAAGKASLSARIALIAVLVQIALGVLTSASWSGAVCPGVDGCAALLGGADWRAFDPWRFAAGSALVHMTHRAASVLVLLAVTLLVWRLRRRDRALCNVLALLLVVQIGLGMTMVTQGLPIVAAVAHNLCAALVLLAVARAQQRLRSDPDEGALI